jgi:hypothetical protein
MSACNAASTLPTASGGTTSIRSYNGTASVGDFVQITVNATNHTIAYTDPSNNTSGTANYTVNSDGSYAISDPNGDLVSGFEIPNYAMILAARKTGPGQNTPSLITAVESGPISLSTWGGKKYNYLEYRTQGGGVEVGSVAVDAQGGVTGVSYRPYGATIQGPGAGAFSTLAIPDGQLKIDQSGTFFTLAVQGQTNHIFGTANGQFIVDTPSGSILGLAQAASTAFDPLTAGTYNTQFYTKTNAFTDPSSVESGTVTLGKGSVTIDASGNLTALDANGTTVAQGVLTPLSQVSSIVGAGELVDPCPGVFTFKSTTSSSDQSVFVVFQGSNILFASFTTPVPATGTYGYFYGTGLR